MVGDDLVIHLLVLLVRKRVSLLLVALRRGDDSHCHQRLCLGLAVQHDIASVLVGECGGGLRLLLDAVEANQAPLRSSASEVMAQARQRLGAMALLHISTPSLGRPMRSNVSSDSMPVRSSSRSSTGNHVTNRSTSPADTLVDWVIIMCLHRRNARCDCVGRHMKAGHLQHRQHQLPPPPPPNHDFIINNNNNPTRTTYQRGQKTDVARAHKNERACWPPMPPARPRGCVAISVRERCVPSAGTVG